MSQNYSTREAASSYIVWHKSVIKSYVNEVPQHAIIIISRVI